MARDEQRWVGRVECGLAARIQAIEGWTRVRVRDLSRNGAQLTIDPPDIGLTTLVPLGELARQLGRVLPERFRVEFDPDKLGDLVGRTAQVVRLGLWDRLDRPIPFGCTFDVPLTDDEAVALGLDLPDHGETRDDARRRLRAAHAGS